MPDLEAKRTLVKSPPELWEELSEVDRLAKHLGAFGDITITKLEPEHTVAWEGEHASGTVSIEPSGWGTKVTLRADLSEVDAPAPSDPLPGSPSTSPDAPEAPSSPEAGADHAAVPEPPAAPDPPADPHPRAVPDPPAQPIEDDMSPQPEPEDPPEPDAEGSKVPEVTPPERGVSPPKPARRGFWARLFRHWRVDERDRAREDAPAAGQVPDGARDEEPAVGPPPEEDRPGEEKSVADGPLDERLSTFRENTSRFVTSLDGGADSATEEDDPVDLAAAETPTRFVDVEAARAVLDGTLDALGSAHHRPFSRG